MDDLSDEENELEDLVRWSIVILVGFHACIMREIFFLLKKNPNKHELFCDTRRQRYIMEDTAISYLLVDP